MSAPWASATIGRKGDKWQDDLDVALVGRSTGSRATATANSGAAFLTIGMFGTSHGRSTPDVRLNVHRVIKQSQAPSSGGSQVVGMLGWIRDMEVVIQGSSTIFATDTLVGTPRQLGVTINGGATVDPPYLDAVSDGRLKEGEERVNEGEVVPGEDAIATGRAGWAARRAFARSIGGANSG